MGDALDDELRLTAGYEMGFREGYEAARRDALNQGAALLAEIRRDPAWDDMSARDARRLADVIDGIGNLGERIRTMTPEDVDGGGRG